MRVQDKSIIVTGSGGGIGEGIAKRLAANGAKFSPALCWAAFISGVCLEVDGARCV